MPFHWTYVVWNGSSSDRPQPSTGKGRHGPESTPWSGNWWFSVDSNKMSKAVWSTLRITSTNRWSKDNLIKHLSFTLLFETNSSLWLKLLLSWLLWCMKWRLLPRTFALAQARSFPERLLISCVLVPVQQREHVLYIRSTSTTYFPVRLHITALAWKLRERNCVCWCSNNVMRELIDCIGRWQKLNTDLQKENSAKLIQRN